MDSTRTEQTDLVVRYMLSLSRNGKVKVIHMAMIFAILHIGIADGASRAIKITRKRVMEIAHIQSIATYHKYLRELERMGYIKYYPSYHPKEGSLVQLIL